MKTITAATITVPSATGVLTSDTTNISDGDTVTIGSVTYRFKDTLASNYDVKRHASDADTSLGNLVKAIMASGTNNTDYKLTTHVANAQVTAGAVAAHATTITAIESGLDGNSIVTTTTAAHLSFAAATLTGGDAITIVGTVAEQTFSNPGQRVSVEDVPEGNTRWSRTLRITDAAIFCIRYGLNQSPVAMLASVWSKIAVAIEPTLSWPPRITTQPSDQTVSAASGTATFALVATSENADLTYAWYESTTAGGSTFGSALTTGGIYNVATPGSLIIDPTDTTKNGFVYKCVVTNAAGSTTSTLVVLTVTA